MKSKNTFKTSGTLIILIAFLLSLTSTFTSCKPDPGKLSKIDTTNTMIDEEGRLRFIFIAPCYKEEFFQPVKKGIQDAANDLNVAWEFTGTIDVDIPKQVELVEKAIVDRYDGIALSIIHPTLFDHIIKKAIESGVPVVAFNVDDSETSNARLSAVRQDVYMAGRKLGEKVLEFIPENEEVLLTVHSRGISALDDRLKGIQEILTKKNIAWQIVETGITPDGASQIITTALKDHPSIKTILCTGQADTEGAGIAIEKNFKDMGYLAAGFDLSPGILKHIENGNLKFTIDQQPYIQGYYPVVQLAQYIRYGITPSNIEAGANVVSSQIVDKVQVLSQEGYR